MAKGVATTITYLVCTSEGLAPACPDGAPSTNTWCAPPTLQELREYRSKIPCIVVANKIDMDYSVTQKSFGFAKKHSMPFYFVSAADGTNVVEVRPCRFRPMVWSTLPLNANVATSQLPHWACHHELV